MNDIDKIIKKPIEFFPPDRCQNCGWDSIELYDFFGSPMHFHSLLRDKKLSLMLNKKAVYRMRCNRCGTEYTIKWDGDIPWPELADNDKRFISRFKHLYEG